MKSVEVKLLTGYDPASAYPYWACLDDDQRGPGKLFGIGWNRDSAIECLFRLMLYAGSGGTDTDNPLQPYLA